MSDAPANIPLTEVYEQIDRIVAFSEIESQGRTIELLKYLINETYSGRANRLKAYNIGLDVFRKGDDFDPSRDSIVRVETHRLRKLLEGYYRVHKEKGEIIISIPKGNYTPSITRAERDTIKFDKFNISSTIFFFLLSIITIYLYSSFKSSQFCSSSQPALVALNNGENSKNYFNKFVEFSRYANYLDVQIDENNLCTGVPVYYITISTTSKNGPLTANIKSAGKDGLVWSKTYEPQKNALMSDDNLLPAQLVYEISYTLPRIALKEQWDDADSYNEYKCLLDSEKYFDNLQESSFKDTKECLRKYAFTSSSANLPAMYAASVFYEGQRTRTAIDLTKFNKVEFNRAIEKAKKIDPSNNIVVHMLLRYYRILPEEKEKWIKIGTNRGSEIINQISKEFNYEPYLLNQGALYTIPYLGNIEQGIALHERSRLISNGDFDVWPYVLSGVIKKDWNGLIQYYQQISWLEDGDYLLIRLKLAKISNKGPEEERVVREMLQKAGMKNFEDLVTLNSIQNRSAKFEKPILELGCEFLKDRKGRTPQYCLTGDINA